MPDRLTEERLKPNLSPEFRAAVLGDIQEGRIPMDTAIAVLRSALLDLEALDAEVRALRRVAEAAGAAERAWSTFHRQREMTADMSAQFDLVPTQEWWSLRTALAEWRRVRGE